MAGDKPIKVSDENYLFLYESKIELIREQQDLFKKGKITKQKRITFDDVVDRMKKIIEQRNQDTKEVKPNV